MKTLSFSENSSFCQEAEKDSRFIQGVNHGFWSHFGCPGWNASFFSRQGIFQVITQKKPAVKLSGIFKGTKKAPAELQPRPDLSPLGVQFKFSAGRTSPTYSHWSPFPHGRVPQAFSSASLVELCVKISHKKVMCLVTRATTVVQQLSNYPFFYEQKGRANLKDLSVGHVNVSNYGN